MFPTSDPHPAIVCQWGNCDIEATIFDHGHWCEDHYHRAMDFFRPVMPRG